LEQCNSKVFRLVIDVEKTRKQPQVARHELSDIVKTRGFAGWLGKTRSGLQPRKVVFQRANPVMVLVTFCHMTTPEGGTSNLPGIAANLKPASHPKNHFNSHHFLRSK
jgi:hypothetical protein